MQDRREVTYDSIKSAGYYSNRVSCIVSSDSCYIFFNLDMKFAAVLIKPLTAYYNWSKNRREVKKKKEQDTQK